MIDNALQRALGILGDEKRIYRFEEGEVSREEFEQCVLIDQVVFGPKGYVESLGPTWDMIHDPRFNILEAKFIVKRRGRLGGDATLGKQYISGAGQFSSSIVDLEQYSDIIGEGRNFFCFLQHPEPKCPEREWLERTWKQTKYQPGPDIICLCKPEEKFDPHAWKDQPDEVIWDLIKKEWPNYFRLNSLNATAEQLMADITHEEHNRRYRLVNKDGARLYNLSKADLVGLIADYCQTAHADDWTVVDSDDAAAANEGNTEVYKVSMEVDYLDKALSFRATLRATAAKILQQRGFAKFMNEMDKEIDTRLTDLESDKMLRMIYQSDYPNDIALLLSNLMLYVKKCWATPYPLRYKQQIEDATTNAAKVMTGLKDGTILPVNQVTDAAPEDTRTIQQRYKDYCSQMIEWGESVDEFDDWFAGYQRELIQAAIFKNPLKKDLFLIFTEAERNAYNDVADLERRKVVCEISLAAANILAPVFEKPEFVIGEDEYDQLMKAVKKTGYFELAMKAYNEEFHTAESHLRSTGEELDPVTLLPIPVKELTMDEVWENSLKKIKPKGNA